MSEHKQIVKETLQTFLDTFAGTDGGISFIQFRTLLETLADQADNGDYGSADIIDRVAKVAALIEYSKGK